MDVAKKYFNLGGSLNQVINKIPNILLKGSKNNFDSTIIKKGRLKPIR